MTPLRLVLRLNAIYSTGVKHICSLVPVCAAPAIDGSVQWKEQ